MPRKTALIIALWMFAVLGPAATLHAQDEFDQITRVFEIDYVEPGQLAETLRLFAADVRANDELNTLTVRTSRQVMPAIEDVIRRLDVLKAERAVELKVHILRAWNQDVTGNIPENLRSVVEQLENTFSFQSFQLVDTILVSGFDGGQPNVQGTISLANPDNDPVGPTSYRFQGQFRIRTSDDGPSILRIEEMRSSFRVPTGRNVIGEFGPRTEYVDAGITTDVEIPEGSQVVVGRATVGNSALILVMTAEFLN